jgi:T-complex protein 11
MMLQDNYIKNRASNIIKRFWSKCQSTKQVANAFLQNQLMSEHCEALGFDQLVLRLRDPKVIERTRNCLQRIHARCISQHGSGANQPPSINVRVFLAGFLIAHKRENVFESLTGRKELSLYSAAVPLLQSFRYMVDHLSARPWQTLNKKITSQFHDQLCLYMEKFKDWKVVDEEKLLKRITHALKALYESRRMLPADHEGSALSSNFQTQIDRLRGKLRQIGGQQALEAFDRDLQVPVEPIQTFPQDHVPGRISNEALALEILYDPNFQLSDDFDGSKFVSVRQCMHRAFWQSLTDDLRLSTPCIVRVLRVINEIRDGLVDLCGDDVKPRVQQACNTSDILERFEQGKFSHSDWVALFAAAFKLIMDVQAPKRDAETRELYVDVLKALESPAPEAITKALEFFLNRVNIMRVDAANQRLRLIEPVIKQHGHQYFRDKFDEKLAAGTLTIKNLKLWIARCVKKEANDKVTEWSRNFTLAQQKSLHIAMMIDLVKSPEPITTTNCPETLILDVKRLEPVRKSVLCFAKCLTFMVRAQRTYKSSDIDSELATFFATQTNLTSEELCAKFDSLGFAKASVSWFDALDPVVCVFVMRIAKYLTAYLSNGKPPANPQIAPLMAPLLHSIDEKAHTLMQVSNMTMAVHGERYLDLIAEYFKYAEEREAKERKDKIEPLGVD